METNQHLDPPSVIPLAALMEEQPDSQPKGTTVTKFRQESDIDHLEELAMNGRRSSLFSGAM